MTIKTAATLVCATVFCVDFSLTPASAEEDSPMKIVVKENLVYGRVHGAGLLADVAWPESDKPLPAIISVHGGRW
jgi:hypothetical protein